MVHGMLLLISCFSNSSAPPDPAPPDPTPAPATESVAPTPLPWPRPSVDGVPGWVGFAVSTERASFEEIPVLTDISAYTLPQGLAWRDFPAGAGVLAVHPGGQTALRFGGIAEQPLGCDGMRQEVAQLTGGSMRPGPVWLLPPQSTDARALSFSADPPAADRRSWRIDGVELSLVKTAAYTAELRLGGTVLKTIDTSEVMDGAEAEVIDLTTWTLYADEVLAAWLLPEVGRAALTRWPSLEGAHYDLILLDQGVLRGDAASVYLCAF